MSTSGGSAGLNGYPAGATPFAIRGSTAGVVLNLIMPAVAGKTAYVTGVDISGSGATVGQLITVTLGSLVGGITLQYVLGVPTGATSALTPLDLSFSPSMPANAPNAAVTLSVPALGAGATTTVANIRGYYL